jgi:hypothetical protein
VRSPRRHEPNTTRTGSNGRRMSEISRSVQIVKQAKKFVNCTVHTVAGVAGSYADVARLSWQTVGSCEVESYLDTWHIFYQWEGATWPRHGLPRGTVFGLVVKIIWSLWGSDPGPPALVEGLHTAWATNSPRISSYYIYGIKYI